jgi:hypothetical protein
LKSDAAGIIESLKTLLQLMETQTEVVDQNDLADNLFDFNPEDVSEEIVMHPAGPNDDPQIM